MIYPTINELSKNEYNRYEIALATAKCARMITNEYTRQRVEAERQMTGNKETDKPLNTMIDKEVRDEKAVKLAIGRIYKGEYTIVHKDPAEQEREEQAILAGINRPYEDLRIDDLSEDLSDDLSEDLSDDLSEDLAEDDLSEDASDETVDSEELTEEAVDGDTAEEDAADAESL